MISSFLPRTECGITVPVLKSGRRWDLIRDTVTKRTQVEARATDAFESTTLELHSHTKPAPPAVHLRRTRRVSLAPSSVEHKEAVPYAGDPDSPWHQEPPPHGSRSNLGAYGGTTQASKSP